MDGIKLFISLYVLLCSDAEPIVVGFGRFRFCKFARATKFCSSPIFGKRRAMARRISGRPPNIHPLLHGDRQGVATLRVMGVNAPQCDGLLAFPCLGANTPGEHDVSRRDLVIYRALYKWCRLEGQKQHPGFGHHGGECP